MTPEVVRRKMRNGMDTVDIAKQATRYNVEGHKKWTEAHIWNILAERDRKRCAASSVETWAHGLRVVEYRP